MLGPKFLSELIYTIWELFLNLSFRRFQEFAGDPLLRIYIGIPAGKKLSTHSAVCENLLKKIKRTAIVLPFSLGSIFDLNSSVIKQEPPKI